MKKVIAMVTVLLMLVSLSSAVFADDTASKELQQVLVEVKEKVDIPDLLCEFEGNVQTSNKRTIYNFSWSDEKYEKSISVKADAEGRIIGYSDYSKEITQKKLTGFSKEEIKLFADTFQSRHRYFRHRESAPLPHRSAASVSDVPHSQNRA